MTSLSNHFQSVCEKNADRTALSYEGKHVSYGELLSRSPAPARPYWLHHGPKSLDAAVALFSCLRSGTPFVPLDCSWPAARVNNARAVLNKAGALHHEDAVVLFTSGSTGEPKGIPLSAENIEYFLKWSTRLLGFDKTDVFPNVAPLGFDLSVLDILGAWYVGARVELFAPEAVYDPPSLCDRLASEFTSMYATPSLLMHLESKGELAKKLARGTVRRLVYAGESYPVGELRKLFDGGRDIYNFYGPTETNVCAYHRVRKEDLSGEAIPIGKAPEGTELRLRDGELEIRSPGVMRGYLGGAPSTGRFATRDRARLDSDGNFVFLGRSDRQVKIRGYRVELEEIEAVLNGLAGVQRGCVSLQDGLLIAHLEAARSVSLEKVKAHIAKTLPPHMSVNALVCYPEGLPLTERGKIDIKKLRPA